MRMIHEESTTLFYSVKIALPMILLVLLWNKEKLNKMVSVMLFFSTGCYIGVMGIHLIWLYLVGFEEFARLLNQLVL
ncbi:hypothetical protein G3578_01055 [Brevibacillus sp. SYP-B805]|nr:hypothetical protein [Brevibacillus sp. SYP-B805]